MFRKFLSDVRGNYMMLTGIVMVPLLGGLALAVDYADMSRERQDTLNALDAAGIATARRLLEGNATDEQVRAYAREFYNANLGSVKPEKSELIVQLPTNTTGGGRVKLQAITDYDPHFLPPFLKLLNGKEAGEKKWSFRAESEVQLKNTVEVALVLDNSGSMGDPGKDTREPRLKLLKSASIQLVEQMANAAKLMKGIEKPVQFSLVPFAASVNIGADNASESWMDREGISPIHHENFNWATLTAANKKIQQTATGPYPYKKVGNGWGSAQGQTVSRFTLFADLRNSVCGSNCSSQALQSFSWGGCVETRPYPYNTDDTPANSPATLYVPMFGPDEAGDFKWDDDKNDNLLNFNANNTWWNDATSNSDAKTRQRFAAKYYTSLPAGFSLPASGKGPNASCTTTAITPLTDITKTTGLNAIKAAINGMAAGGNTNVPEGMAWGWRTLSSQAPFTGGRSETERGNDKVVIVLTDGANTYSFNDAVGNKSTYAAYGYARLADGNPGRVFSGTTYENNFRNSYYSSGTYPKAMNQHFLKLCENANGGDTGNRGAGLIVMTVALDLDANDAEDKEQIAMLNTCASRSRYARDPDDPTKGRKLFWNATSKKLNDVFKEIADELSNLRIVM
ncbi:pilus assembly protein TadG-related protein [Arvimicrobium flavum]|uniref:pilus assembly protein TadG-related protein n=1 Tax=Arvimicrobium flavum TaxID=3393320 RepID=UPI00237BF111|nr:pilus assembly protein TadG-related protein [Mesorhizobium shangrilense]